MGMDAFAYVMYGFEIDHEFMRTVMDELYDDFNGDLDDFFSVKQGVVFPKGVPWDSPEVEKYEEALKALPVSAREFSRQGQDGPYIVYVEATLSVAEWNGPEVLKNKTWIPAVHWSDELYNFCDKTKIPWSEPNWILVADFG